MQPQSPFAPAMPVPTQPGQAPVAQAPQMPAPPPFSGVDAKQPMPDPLEREDIKGALRQLYRQSRDYVDDNYAPRIEAVWGRYDGKVAAPPAFVIGKDEAGNDVSVGSKVVVREVWDKVQAVLPELARIFLSTEEIVHYMPKRPGDENFTEQATDCANHIYWSENDGEEKTLDAIISWLVMFSSHKVYWQPSEREEYHRFDNLSAETVQGILMQDPEIVDIDAQEQVISVDANQMGPTGQVVPMQRAIKTYSGWFKRQVKEGAICIELIPQEETVIHPGAQKESEALFVGQDSYRLVSDVIEMGVDKDTVLKHAGHGQPLDRNSGAARARRGRINNSAIVSDVGNEALRYVRVCEAKVRIDTDDDGKAEFWRVLFLGEGGEPVAMAPGDDIYFVIASPYRRPHEPIGMGVAEAVADIQEQLTATTRGLINNLNRANNPREVIGRDDTAAYLDMSNPYGGPIRAEKPEQLGFHVVPFVGDKAFPLLDYFANLSANRTGITPAGQGLDADVLKGQTVDGAKAIVTAPQSRIEFLAREYAAGVMRPIFRCILKLLVAFQDKKMAFRLRDDWVEVDPRQWNAEMDASIKVGLGTGTRSEKLQALQLIKQTQEALLAQPGVLSQASLLVTVHEYRETLQAICELIGFKNAARFFKDVSDQDIQAHGQQLQQQQQQQLQQAVAVEQAKASAQAQAKGQADVAVEQLRQQGQAQLKDREIAFQGQLENLKAGHASALAVGERQHKENLALLEASLGQDLERLKAQTEIQVTNIKNQFAFQLKSMELEMEMELEKTKMKNQSSGGNGDLREVSRG